MKTIENYIDKCKELTGSDYATAKALGVEKSVISSIRRRGAIADENAVKVAELLGVEPEEILIAAAMARSHGAVKTAWEKIAKKLSTAASVLLLIGGTYENVGREIEGKAFNEIYIMRTVRRFIEWLKRKAGFITLDGTALG